MLCCLLCSRSLTFGGTGISCGSGWPSVSVPDKHYIDSKLTTESQIDYNKQWERPEFEVGFEYAFVLKTCLYTAFFMSLQPIILLIGAVGLFLMYHS